MRVLPVASNNCYAKKEQKPNFKSKFVKNDVLQKTVAQAEKKRCRFFLGAVKNLLNDGIPRTLELTGGEYLSKDGISYTKTQLNCNGKKEAEYAGFPNIYGTTSNEMIANDGRLLIIDYAKGYATRNINEYIPLTQDEAKEEYKKIKEQLFK